MQNIKNTFKFFMLISSVILQSGELSHVDRETLSICYGEDKVRGIGTRQQMLLFLAQQAIEHRKSVGKLIQQTFDSREGEELKGEFRLKHGQFGLEEWEHKIKPAYERLDKILLGEQAADIQISSIQELLFFAQEAIDHRKAVEKFQQASDEDEMEAWLEDVDLVNSSVAVQTDEQELEEVARLRCELDLSQSRRECAEKSVLEAHKSLAKSESAARSAITSLEAKLTAAQNKQVCTERFLGLVRGRLAVAELKTAKDRLDVLGAPSRRLKMVRESMAAPSRTATIEQDMLRMRLMRLNRQMRSHVDFVGLSKRLEAFTESHVDVTERVISNNNEYCSRAACYLIDAIPRLLKLMQGVDVDTTNPVFLHHVKEGTDNITRSILADDGSIVSIFESKRLQYEKVTRNWFACQCCSEQVDSDVKRLDEAIKLIENMYKFKKTYPGLFRDEKLSEHEEEFCSSVQKQALLLRKSTAQLCTALLNDLITMQDKMHKSIDSIIAIYCPKDIRYPVDLPETLLFGKDKEGRLRFEIHTAKKVFKHCAELATEKYLLPEEEAVLQRYRQLMDVQTPFIPFFNL